MLFWNIHKHPFHNSWLMLGIFCSWRRLWSQWLRRRNQHISTEGLAPPNGSKNEFKNNNFFFLSSKAEKELRWLQRYSPEDFFGCLGTRLLKRTVQKSSTCSDKKKSLRWWNDGKLAGALQMQSLWISHRWWTLLIQIISINSQLFSIPVSCFFPSHVTKLLISGIC